MYRLFQLKQIDLRDGLRLVQRNSGSVKFTVITEMKAFRTRGNLAEFAAHALLASVMVQPMTQSDLLEELVHERASIHKLNYPLQTLENMVRRMIDTAESTQHIYVFCKALFAIVSNIVHFSVITKCMCV